MSPINIMALRHSAFYTPLLITICGGFLNKQGLEPHYSVATPSNSPTEGIRAGRVHLSQSAVATSFSALDQQQTCDIVHFAQINERDGFFITGREPQSEFNWTQLKGKQVLVDHFFQPLAMFRYALHKQDIRESDVNFVDAGNVDNIDKAFREGQGDFVHQQGPAPQQLEKDGLGYIVANVGQVIGPVAFSSLCASRTWLQSSMAQAFIHAYQAALNFVFEAEPMEVARLEAEFFPHIDIKVLAKTIATYQSLGCWSPSPVISIEAYNALLDIFIYNGLITTRHPMDSCVLVPPGYT